MRDRDLWVDFNDADSHDRLSTLLEYAQPGVSIQVGSTIVVGDDEGNRCHAEVLSIEDGVVELVLAGDSFAAAGPDDEAELMAL